MISIILVEDNDIVRAALARLMSDESDMKVIAKLACGQEALELIQQGTIPDIIVADLNMHGMSGIELTRRVVKHYGNVAVIILTMHDKSVFRQEALEAGAKEYLLKGGDLSELPQAIRKVYAAGHAL